MTRILIVSAIVMSIGLMTAVCHGQLKTPYKKNAYVFSLQTTSIEMDVMTRDKALLNTEITAIFYIKKEDVAKIDQTIGPNYAKQLVPAVIKSGVSKILGQYSSDEIMSARREEIENAVLQGVKKRLDQYYIHVRELFFTSVRYSPEMEQAIEAKLVAAQNREAAKINYEKSKMELRFQKEAAESQAEMNGIISGGLDKKILLLKYIEVLEKLALTPGNHVVVLGEAELDLPNLGKLVSPKRATPVRKNKAR